MMGLRPLDKRVAGASGRIEDRKGQSLVEYSIILLLVAVVCVGSVTVLGGVVNDLYSRINGSF